MIDVTASISSDTMLKLIHITADTRFRRLQLSLSEYLIISTLPNSHAPRKSKISHAPATTNSHVMRRTRGRVLHPLLSVSPEAHRGGTTSMDSAKIQHLLPKNSL
ncbi:hypothetical protein AXF42_Ash003104 [Apostasia shenzhenica]|uniref:Uncharacterized protein n=1 Tax=Apostasia shenzhenica TaxID=1088818 RepID=A0A2I0A878_9ASPA|nr:hypothetical protein AXF42_Ash003104 [Apostasia shenzhenica]